MTKIDELIRELCPDGVEYVRLGTLCSLITKQTGFDYTKHIKARLLMEPTKNAVPYIQTKFFSGKNFNYQTDYYVPMDIVEQFPKITLDEKCILFSIVGASIGNVGLFPGERKCFLGGAICVAKVLPQYDVDYVYYCVESHNVQHQIRRKAKGAGQATITVEDIREFEIPLPPIEVQREIVRMLDNYTKSVVGLQKQLTAEFTARKTQYSFYRSRLLTFDANVEWKTVDEIAEVTDYVANGSFAALKENVNYKHTPDYAILVRTTDLVNGFDEENLVYIDKHAYNYLSKSKLYGGEIIINNIGAGVGTTFLCPCLDTYMSLAPNSIMVKTNNNKFYYYWLNSKEGQNAIRKIVSQGSLPKFNKTGFRSIRLPVPPLDVQNRIVNVLDNFEKICSDLNIGLPAEIEARQKQYEYYRDKLLTFAETGNTILSRAEQSRAEQSRALIKLLQYVFGYAVVTLEDIAENCDSMRKPVTSGKREAGEYPYYGASGIVDYVRDYIFDGDYLLVSEDGANLLARSTPIAFSISGKNWVNNHAHVLKFDCYETRRFVEFYLNSIDLAPYISGGAQPKLNQKNLNRIEIPLPSQKRQKYIVDILDRFDAICNDLTSGLPAEIEARQKQYEYYRDKLLTFKEVAAT